jgi:hypothetical protein
MRTHYKVAALLIVALVFSAAECAASCAFASCNPADTASDMAAGNMPPCHHHSQRPSHQSPAPCGHELQLLGPNASSISQGSVSSLLIAAAPAPSVIESQPDLIAQAPLVPILSPPQLSTASPLVLRI